MKVIAKRKYYEKDLYRYPTYPDPSAFALDEMPTKKDMILVHKKGDLMDYDFQIKYCCPWGRSHIKYKRQWSDPDDRMIPGAFLYLENGDERIDYCSFCGEKIEMYEKE